MKILRKMKKGFTIVELVIVIAVIAILTAILVPTFINISKKANKASDNSLVTNLNTALKMAEGDPEVFDGHKLSDENVTMHDAVLDLKAYGYYLEQLVTKSGEDLLYSLKENKFYLSNDSEINSKYNAVEKVQYLWAIHNSITGSEKYSVYAGSKWSQPVVTNLHVGFDAGDRTDITSVTYSGEATQEVVIRTNSFATTVSINAPKDTVKHYGNAAVVNVEAIASASYHENGTVGRLSVESGHAVAEPEAIIFCFNNNGATESTPSTVEVKSGAIVYNNDGEAAGLEAVNTTTETFKDDCGAGHHDFGSQLVIDDKVYEVCKSCGYTLVTVVDLAGNETKTTMVDESTGEIVNTPIETYNDSATNELGQVVENKEEPIVETPEVSDHTDVTCNHNFVSTVSIEATCTQTGVKTFKCSICGASYTSNIPMKAHQYYDNIGGVHTADEHCAVCDHVRGEYVAEVNGVPYTTLTDAIAAVPTNGTQTLITLINDDAIEGNAGWTIAATQNIVLDLNGYKLKNLVTADAGSQVIKNLGTLVIKDSSDLNKDGTGTGIIFNQAKEGANIGTWPTYNYVTNIITNNGDFTLQSGYLYLAKGSSISYCIDTQTNGNSYEPKVTINGGKLYNYFTNAIRMFANSTTKANVMEINGGDISGYGSIWVQGPNKSANKFELTINGGTFNTTEKAVVNGTKELCLGSASTIACEVYASGNSGSNYSADSFVKINGGTFNENIKLYKYGGSYTLEGGNLPSLEITGGTFNGYVYANGNSASVKGGSYKFFDFNNGTTTLSDMLESNMFAEGYHATNVSNGYFTVVKD